MRIFGSERIEGVLKKLGLKDGEAIQHSWINRAIEKAQQKVEARNFEVRKQLLEYDDVMNDQRKVIFEQRLEIMHSESVQETIERMRHDVLEHVITKNIPENAMSEEWNIESLHHEVQRIFAVDLPIQKWAEEDGVDEEAIYDRIQQATILKYKEKEKRLGEDILRLTEKNILLQLIDHHWKEHLLHLDHIRNGIGLRAYGQRNPLNEYKQEAFQLFDALLNNLKFSVMQIMSHVEFDVEQPSRDQHHEEEKNKKMAHDSDHDTLGPTTNKKTRRNALCPCGSGKKYKHCHGKGQ